MPTEQQLIGALRQADAAGDEVAANRFAQLIKQSRSQAAERAKLDQELGGNFGEKALIGLGRGFQTVGEGVKGLALDAGNLAGIVDDQTVDNFDAKTKEERDFFKQTPIGKTKTAKVAQFVGEVLPTLPVGGGIVGGVTKSAKAAKLGGVAALGATEGALVSDTGNQLGGAAIGAVAAPALGFAFNKVANGAGNIASRFKGTRNADAALDQVAKDLSADGISAGQVQTKLDDLGNQATIADIGGVNTDRLADVAFQRGGEAADEAKRFLDNRQETSLNRVQDSIESKVGDFDGFLAKQDDIINSLKTKAAPLYEQAYQVTIPFDKSLQDVLLVGGKPKPAVAKAWKEAQDLAQNEGISLSSIGGDGVSTRELDYLKRGLDSIIEANSDSITRKVNTVGRAVSGIKRSLLDVVDSQNPAYAQARNVFADDVRLQTALLEGQNFFRKDAQNLNKRLGELSEGELLLFRQGAAKALRDKLAKAPENANQFKRALGNKFSREQIEAVVGKENFEQFSRELGAENVFSTTRANFQGSQTQPRQQKNAEVFADGVGAISDVATGNRNGLIDKVLRVAANRSAGNDKKASKIVEFMFSQGADQQQVIQKLIELEKKALPAQKSSIQSAIAIVSGNAGGNSFE